MEIVQGGVTYPRGFKACGIAAGIKKRKNDLAMIYSEKECAVAGTYTTNRIKAAPVLWDRDITEHYGTGRAVICNSGVANAGTGEEGMDICRRTAEALAEKIGTDPMEILVASTGVIGVQVPLDKIISNLDRLVDGLDSTYESAMEAEKAIMTTDTKPKTAACRFDIDGTEVRIAGMCKGSGMIHPNMCTMLSFITTDADIDRDLLSEALGESVKDTYNMVSVDGDTSTNDTVLVMANGVSGNKKISKRDDAYKKFCQALNEVNIALAKKIAGDGEGATTLIECEVKNAFSKEDAKTLARSVITSNLTKAAVYGHDANWGRVLCALGYSGADFNPEGVDIYFRSRKGAIKVAENGRGVNFSEDKAAEILGCDEISIVCDMKNGNCSAFAWGCDLTHDYVSINADYRS